MGGSAQRWLPRPTLERRLDAALAHPLTTLTAAPGHGKSTLLDRWGASVGAVTHRLTSNDRDLVHLVTRVTSALRLRVPGLATDGHKVLGSSLGPDGLVDADARATALGADLGQALHEALTRHLVLVLDQSDVLRAEDPSTRFLDVLLRTAPHRLHLVVAARSDPPFPIARLRAGGQVLELTAADLTLDLDEVRDWTTATLGDDAVAAVVHERTGGWPIAVVTTLRELATVPPAERRTALERLGPVPALADLIRRIHDGQPEALRDLVRLAMAVPVVTPDLARHLGFAGAELPIAHRTGTFFDEDDGALGAYRLTPLVREALTEHAADDPATTEALVSAAADWFTDQGRTDLALRTLLRGDILGPVPALLTDHAAKFEAPEHAEEVLRALDRLPAEDAARPELRRLAGICHQTRGDWARASPILAEVADGPAFDAHVAWRLGLVHHLRGELDEALRVYERGAEADEFPADAAICAAWAASVWWLRGERDACAKQADAALAAATRLDDPRALAAAHMVLAMLAALDGDRRANDAHYLKAIDHAERAGDVLQLIRIRSNRASHHLEEGAYDDALADLEVARHLADLTGFSPFGAMTLSNRATVLIRLGRLEEATVDADDAIGAWRALGSRLVVYGLEQRATIQHLRGDTAGAIATWREALAEAEAAADVQGLVPSLAGLAELLAAEDVDEARALADRAVAAGDGMGYVAANLAAARVAFIAGERGRARTHLEQARRSATGRRDRPGLATVLELQAELDADPALAADAVAAWRQLGDEVAAARAELLQAGLTGGDAAGGVAAAVRDRLHGLGCYAFDDRIDALLIAAAPGERAPVVVETLGSSRVLRAGVPIPRSAWQSRKARELVKLLASRRGRPVARGWLIEQLWPDADDPTKAGKRLNVLTSTVRAVLDPDREWPSDHLVVSDRETLWLDRRHVDIDLDRFFGAVETAAQLHRRGDDAEALASWRNAVATYTGAFCEDEVYADWAIETREEARTAYAQAVAAVAAAEAEAGRHDEASRLWLRLLEQDPYDERAHLALVTALRASGRHGDAHRRYLAYVARIRELGAEPAPMPRTPVATALNRT